MYAISSFSFSYVIDLSILSLAISYVSSRISVIIFCGISEAVVVVVVVVVGDDTKTFVLESTVSFEIIEFLSVVLRNLA